jgi:DNA polymerase-3 subunit beta
MKCLIERSTLLTALAAGRSAIDTSSRNPIASHVRLTASTGRMQLDTTDFDVALNLEIPADVEVAGSVAVPIQTLQDLVGHSPEGGEIDLRMAGDRLQVRAGRGVANLACLPADMFGMLDVPAEMAATFTMPAETLARLLAETSFAISPDEKRWNMHGVHFHVDDDGGEKGPRLYTVATTGVELAVSDILAPEGAETMPPIILAKKPAGILKGLLAKAKGDIEIAISETTLAVRIGQGRLISRLVDGAFPAYRNILRRDLAGVAKIDREALIGLIGRVKVFAAERKSETATWHYIELSFEAGESGKGRLVASSTSAAGSIEDWMEIDYTGADATVAIDPVRLIPALQSIAGGVVAIDVFGRGLPLQIVDADRSDFLALFQTKNVGRMQHAG